MTCGPAPAFASAIVAVVLALLCRATLRALAASTDAHDDPREVSSSAPSSGFGAPRPSRGAGGATQLSGIPGWFVVPILAALSACAPHTPPVYSLALPPARSEPAPPDVEPAPADLTLPAVSLLAGDVAPGDGVLVSPVEYASLTWEAGVLAPWLREQWRLERAGREGDRAVAEARAARDGEEIRALRRDARIRTWAALGLGAAGLVVGAGIGIAASSAAEVLP